MLLLGWLMLLPAAASAGTDLGEDPVQAHSRNHHGHQLEVIGDVPFASGRVVLGPRALAVLKTITLKLTGDPAPVIEIVGHTDSVGGEQYNLGLSTQRAEAVSKYLVDHGIEGTRLKVVSRGKYNPDTSERFASGRARNRRVEVRIPRGSRTKKGPRSAGSTE